MVQFVANKTYTKECNRQLCLSSTSVDITVSSRFLCLQASFSVGAFRITTKLATHKNALIFRHPLLVLGPSCVGIDKIFLESDFYINKTLVKMLLLVFETQQSSSSNNSSIAVFSAKNSLERNYNFVTLLLPTAHQSVYTTCSVNKHDWLIW